MAREPIRDIRPAQVRCIGNGHVFTADVPQLGHEVEEGGSQDIVWRVVNTDGVLCSEDGSPVEPVE